MERGAIFPRDYARQRAESEKWSPKVACRHRTAREMHIISLCVRPKVVHKQEIHSFPRYCGSPEWARERQVQRAGSLWGHFGATLGLVWGYFESLLDDVGHVRITFESHWLIAFYGS